MKLGYTVVCLLASLLGMVRANLGLPQQRVLLQQHRLVASYPAAGYKPARQFRLPAAKQKPARLVANSEAQEDLDDTAEELEPRPNAVPSSAAAPVPATSTTQPTVTIAYYPAGAVGFVHPATFAKIIVAPQPASTYGATSQNYVSYYG